MYVCKTMHFETTDGIGYDLKQINRLNTKNMNATSGGNCWHTSVFLLQHCALGAHSVRYGCWYEWETFFCGWMGWCRRVLLSGKLVEIAFYSYTQQHVVQFFLGLWQVSVQFIILKFGVRCTWRRSTKRLQIGLCENKNLAAHISSPTEWLGDFGWRMWNMRLHMCLWRVLSLFIILPCFHGKSNHETKD